MQIVIMYANSNPSMIENLSMQLNKITNFLEFLVTPSKWLLWLWGNIYTYSYIICLFVLIAGLLMKVVGEKKIGNRLMKGSIISYLLINIFNVVII